MSVASYLAGPRLNPALGLTGTRSNPALGADLNATDPGVVAHRVLSQSRYHRNGIRTPIQRPLTWLGDQTKAVVGPIVRALNHVVPGGNIGAIAVALVAACAVVIAVLARVRKRSVTETISGDALKTGELQRLAAEAIRTGDYRMAIIYSFRSGIANLVAGPRPRAAVTPNAVLATKTTGIFQSLGDTFDGVRYGDAPATAAEAEMAVKNWPLVLEALGSEESAPKKPKDPKVPKDIVIGNRR